MKNAKNKGRAAAMLLLAPALAACCAAGCATQTTTVSRTSNFGSGLRGMNGRPGIIVEVHEDGLRYLGNRISRERLVKRLFDDEDASTAALRLGGEQTRIMTRPVHLTAKDLTPSARLVEYAEYLNANNIPNVVIVTKPIAIAQSPDDFISKEVDDAL